MASKRTEIEQARVNALKTGRSIIRLKHSLAADVELNTKLPLLEQAFDDAVAQGQLPDEATTKELLAVVLSG